MSAIEQTIRTWWGDLRRRRGNTVEIASADGTAQYYCDGDFGDLADLRTDHHLPLPFKSGDPIPRRLHCDTHNFNAPRVEITYK